MIYSVIDVETTGLSPAGGDRVLEIGIARLNEDGSIEAVLDTLVNPERPVSATQVHGISDAMVADAPRFADLCSRIDSLLDGTVISAHNAAFDMSFLKEEFRRSGHRLPAVQTACTLLMARRHLAALPSRSLESCRRYLGISDEGAHNALADAVSAAKLLKYFLEQHLAVPEASPYRALGIPRPEPGLFESPKELKPAEIRIVRLGSSFLSLYCPARVAFD